MVNNQYHCNHSFVLEQKKTWDKLYYLSHIQGLRIASQLRYATKVFPRQ